jgi:hypothetical protein
MKINFVPDAKKHLIVSILKSMIRIVAGIMFIAGLIVAGGVLIILAEILGIIEEIV